MKLYILRPVENLQDDNPWDPWYDKSFGFIISATSQEEAREIADTKAGDENYELGVNTKRPWLEKGYSTCEILTPSEVPEMIMIDFSAA